MAKRFIDTGFYSSPFVRGLRGPYKALYSYLFLNCDHAGVWQVELDIAAMRLDQKRIDPAAALKAFGGKVIALPGGTKWFLVSFIEWQYGELNAANRAHASVLAILKANGLTYPLDPSTEKKEGACKGLTSPLQGAKDMDMDMDMDMDKNSGEKERAESKPTEPLPFASPAFADAVARWERHRAEIKHKLTPEARKAWLKKCEAMGEAAAIAAIDHSIANGWTGMFPPKTEDHRPPAPHRSAERKNLVTDWDYKSKRA